MNQTRARAHILGTGRLVVDYPWTLPAANLPCEFPTEWWCRRPGSIHPHGARLIRRQSQPSMRWTSLPVCMALWSSGCSAVSSAVRRSSRRLRSSPQPARMAPKRSSVTVWRRAPPAPAR